ncbi:MAG TPA: NAD-dependent epimerase/dehydratase family protein [Acidobacteriaceae bacterium]|nr:NAD-dependent epimerase/dehydratase family protein [Acidobacteriaceae bacterium]
MVNYRVIILPMRILIPGGSGQVGMVLARHLTDAGHNVTVLSHAPKPAPWKAPASEH